MAHHTPRLRQAVAALAAALLLAAGCSSDPESSADSTDDTPTGDFTGTLRVGAIPDQDPEKLARTYGLLADYIEGEVDGVTVEYVPVTDYSGAVSSFSSGTSISSGSAA